MDSKDDRSNIPNSISTVSFRLRNLIIGTFLLGIATYLGLRSSAKPGGLLHGARIWYHSYTSPQIGYGSNRVHIASDNDMPGCWQDSPPLPAVRTRFLKTRTMVYGWPSTGGIWVHEDCHGVELDFLGLSRFEPAATERYSKEEDDFCKRLEWIGAHFYESEYEYEEATMFENQEPQMWYGWPGTVPDGGVWALWTTGVEGAKLGVSRIINARTMEERCKVIEMLGGKFYDKWEDMPKPSKPVSSTETAEWEDMPKSSKLNVRHGE